MSITTICVSDEDRQDVFKGADLEISVKLTKDEKDFDLSSNTEMEAVFFTSATTGLSLFKTAGELTAIEEKCGTIKITLSNVNSSLLLAGPKLDIEMLITIAGKITIFRLEEAINVIDRMIPVP